ncbi:unnamed protein product [Tuber aestivum]|uniref:Myb-like DNA-binding domain-containing protein n=1 Tax=Tuber aestivum TaxID=59557 RepID=A0A292PS70_9PEZI|nr:unnamed protein product [Tuber aestivum]
MASSDDYKFLLSCLMNHAGKIDFEAVARETGYTNPRSASNRLASIKKNHAAAMAAAAASGTSSLTASGSKEQPLAAPAAPPPQAQSAGAKRRVGKKAKAVKRGREEGEGGGAHGADPEDKASKRRKGTASGDEGT